MSMSDAFWEEAEQVERFADRDPDKRLVGMLMSYEEPASVSVLDIGCAGGRNAELLARHGFDVYAIDTSRAMVERTCERVAAFLGREEAQRRVTVATMDDLSQFADASFQLIVALGVYHSAQTRDQWDRSLAESARVLAPWGRLLVSNFSPRTDPNGDGRVKPVSGEAGEAGVYEGMQSGYHVLMEAEDVDADMRRNGLVPVTKTDTVVVARERGAGVTVNGLYQKG
jgi:SAM-dependent methyltransferase